jgi:hypothetical protein
MVGYFEGCNEPSDSIKCEELLSSCGCVNFSGRTLVNGVE